MILVRPSEEGNVGAVARAMANMGLERLVLVEPAVAIGQRALARAVGAREILETAERRASVAEAIAPYQLVVGTSSHRERSTRTPVIEPRQLADLFSRRCSTRTALVFGPERSGLTIEELSLCGTIVRIPTASKQPTLNLAQAVLIVAHELFAARRRNVDPAGPAELASPEATGGEVAGLFDHVDSALRTVGFARDSTYEGVVRDLRRLAGRARLTQREVAILRGLCRRLEHAVGERRGALPTDDSPSGESSGA